MIAVVATGTKNGDLGARREKLIEKTIGVCIDELKLDRFRAVIHVKQTRSKKYMDGWAVGYATMDKVETEFDWDNLPLQESNWFQSIDGKLNPGSYILVQDIASPLTGELIAKANSRIKVTEQIEPHDTFLGMSIYKVKHQTGQDIYITNGDIVR